jgi:hypothetical protein
VIGQALRWDTWHCLDETTRYQRIELCHYGMAQRWLVVSSQAARERAKASINKAQQREAEGIEKQLFHPVAAQAALGALATSWRYHQGEILRLIAHKHYA